MVTFTINIPKCKHIYHTWILWVIYIYIYVQLDVFDGETVMKHVVLDNSGLLIMLRHIPIRSCRGRVITLLTENREDRGSV